MIAPTTLAVAAIFSAEKRNGIEAGTRSFQSTDQRLAAYERIRSIACGSADCTPRSELIVTGKNVRYAAITDTRTHAARCEESSVTPAQPSQPNQARFPRPTTIMGEMTISGTV